MRASSSLIGLSETCLILLVFSYQRQKRPMRVKIEPPNDTHRSLLTLIDLF